MDPDSKDGDLYACGGVLDRHDDLEEADDPERICDAALLTRAQDAQVTAMLALGAFIAAYEPSPKPSAGWRAGRVLLR